MTGHDDAHALLETWAGLSRLRSHLRTWDCRHLPDAAPRVRVAADKAVDEINTVIAELGALRAEVVKDAEKYDAERQHQLDVVLDGAS